MFYSQFILAKKGPLGTIWIAAHLERKLRKNQVADTDIGDSVDSILFPDAPIALRLSSHLLLGVVRIYSRKVNYLFDDCSEALLKVKQAFRSATVDLPPEESTAPYHSITLPETFDLDDFELPDNEIFQGNYVDHHVSAREQITLQDTTDGVVYSTSQFGLDERFGDGETSEINLELEEEVFQDKETTTGNEGDPGDDQEAFSDAITAMRRDETKAEAAEPMVVDGSNDQVEDLAANSESNEYAQAPQTPGLVEVPNMSRAEDELACDDHMEVDYNASDCVVEDPKSALSELDNTQQAKSTKCCSENDLNQESSENIQPFENGDVETGRASCELLRGSIVTGDNSLVDGKIDTETELGTAKYMRVDSPCCSHMTNELEDIGQAPKGQKDHNDNNTVDNSIAHASEAAAPAMESPGRPIVVDASNPVPQEPAVSEAPREMQGDQYPATDSRKSEEQADNLLDSDNHFENPTGSIGPDMPAPEKLLSMPEGLIENQNDFMMESTPDKEVLGGSKRDEGTKVISGKKRTFTESTLTAESFNSYESVGLMSSRKIAKSIPDDDDLLSSILVGKSSFLKMKSTPVLDIASSKRQRSAPRSTAYKRKVVIDDFMVLNGDIIRKQLTCTEDIRRVRKKAPCTLPEILMIHRQFLEDELFKEPIVTGMSVELVTLHSEPYDLKEIRVLERDHHDGAVKDAECSASIAHSNDVQEQPANIPVHQQDRQSEDHHNLGFAKEISEEEEAQPCQTELPSENIEIATDKGDTRAIDEVNISSQNEKNHEKLTEEQNNAAEDVQVEASVVDISNRSGTDPIEAVEDDIVASEMDLKAENGLLPDEIRIGSLVEIKEVEADPYAPCDNKDDPLSSASVDIVGKANQNVQIAELEFENKSPDRNGGSNEEDKTASTCPAHDDRENPIAEEFDLQIGEDAGNSHDGFAGGFHEEMENMAVEHDTEFLNVDDADVALDDEDDDGNETGILENSGWSSRTRAVSKYLQTLFDKEGEHGKNVLSVDNLLVGKTRKEASRMFFETLVLKTKDYIHVEQATPFDSINVKPRSKLMKSIF